MVTKRQVVSELREIGATVHALPESRDRKVFEVDVVPTKEKFEPESAFRARKVMTPSSVFVIAKSREALKRNLRRTGLTKVWKIKRIRKVPKRRERFAGFFAI